MKRVVTVVLGILIGAQAQSASFSCESEVGAGGVFFMKEQWFVNGQWDGQSALSTVDLTSTPTGYGDFTEAALPDPNYNPSNPNFTDYNRYVVGSDSRCNYYLMVPSEQPERGVEFEAYLRGICREYVVFLAPMTCSVE